MSLVCFRPGAVAIPRHSTSSFRLSMTNCTGWPTVTWRGSGPITRSKRRPSVHEAYLRLVDANEIEWKNRVHFFAISATVMRRILVEFARSRGSQKRGGDVRKISLEETAILSPEPDEDLLALDSALTALAAFDSRKAKVVELRFFGGFTEQETADALGVSSDTVLRDWKSAKLWLYREMRRGEET